MFQRFVILQYGSKRPAGKPPTKARLRRDEIAYYLLGLRRTEPKLEACIEKAVHHFGVHHQTVWNVWRECKPLVFEPNGRLFSKGVRYGEPIIVYFDEPPVWVTYSTASFK